MDNVIYFLRKGNARVSLLDKESATDLVYILTTLGCTETFSTQYIRGSKETDELFEVSFMDKTIRVIGQQDSMTIANWMLTSGCKEVTVKVYGVKEDEV